MKWSNAPADVPPRIALHLKWSQEHADNAKAARRDGNKALERSERAKSDAQFREYTRKRRNYQASLGRLG